MGYFTWYPNPWSLTESFYRADAVFVGTAVEVIKISGREFAERYPEELKRLTEPFGIELPLPASEEEQKKTIMHRYRFKISESFKGPAEGEIVFLHRLFDFDQGFRRNETYLVYALDMDTLGLHALLDSRTEELQDAEQDLNYLRRLKTGATGGGFLFGHVVFPRPTPWPWSGGIQRGFASNPRWKATPVSVATIRLFRHSRLVMTAVSDEEGFFSFDNLLPGRYTVIHAMPAALNPDPYELEFEIKSFVTALEVFFPIHEGARIEGTVHYEDGTPASGLLILEKRLNGSRAYTDENGHFSLKHVAPGEVILSVLEKTEGETQDWYYPGVEDRHEAERINAQAGEVILLPIMRIPQTSSAS